MEIHHLKSHLYYKENCRTGCEVAVGLMPSGLEQARTRWCQGARSPQPRGPLLARERTHLAPRCSPWPRPQAWHRPSGNRSGFLSCSCCSKQHAAAGLVPQQVRFRTPCRCLSSFSAFLFTPCALPFLCPNKQPSLTNFSPLVPAVIHLNPNLLFLMMLPR